MLNFRRVILRSKPSKQYENFEVSCIKGKDFDPTFTPSSRYSATNVGEPLNTHSPAVALMLRRGEMSMEKNDDLVGQDTNIKLIQQLNNVPSDVPSYSGFWQRFARPRASYSQHNAPFSIVSNRVFLFLRFPRNFFCAFFQGH